MTAVVLFSDFGAIPRYCQLHEPYSPEVCLLNGAYGRIWMLRLTGVGVLSSGSTGISVYVYIQRFQYFATTLPQRTQRIVVFSVGGSSRHPT